MDYSKITVVINTFKSEDKIYNCLDSINSNIKVIIVENSNNGLESLLVFIIFTNSVICFTVNKIDDFLYTHSCNIINIIIFKINLVKTI